MRERLAFHFLAADDLLAIDAQPSQRLVLGTAATIDREQAAHYARQPVAWTAWRGADILACFGINELFAGAHGVAWAVLAARLGKDHLALTRFMAHEIRTCGLARLELLARCVDVELAVERLPDVSGGELVELVTKPAHATPEVRWAMLLGMTPAHVLRHFGGAGESYVLFERFAPPCGRDASASLASSAQSAAGGRSALRACGPTAAPAIKVIS